MLDCKDKVRLGHKATSNMVLVDQTDMDGLIRLTWCGMEL